MMSKSGSAKSAWSDYVPPDRVDPDAFLFCGADPCWTPAREYKLPDDPDAAAGLCDLCGGDADLMVIGEDSHRICARCMRDRGSGSLSAHGLLARDIAVVTDDPAVPVACPDDPGFVERDGVKVPEKYARLMKG